MDAIFADEDLSATAQPYLGINADYFVANPIVDSSPLDDDPLQLSERRNLLRVAIVGAGPAGCYAVDELSSIEGIEVSIFDRRPAPFGLIRNGVAPDHLDTKLIANQFHSHLSRGSVRCFFNVEVGEDVSIEELLEFHHALIWAGGADGDRSLGIPGETLEGTHSAREFVSWYNGDPESVDKAVDMSGDRAVIIGNGNVALDVARMLTQNVSNLEGTDVADNALKTLRRSRISEVVVVARRGPADAAYTLAELLALAQMEDINLVAESSDVEGLYSIESGTLETSSLLLDRKLQIVKDAMARKVRADCKTIRLRYHLSPKSIDGEGKVESITFERSDDPSGEDGTSGRQVEREILETSLVFRAIGYKGCHVDGLPFDDVAAIVPNHRGRVMDPLSDKPLPGLYCTGWIKRGANGVIGTNKDDSSKTIRSLLDDFSNGTLGEPRTCIDQLIPLIRQRQPDVIDYEAWRRIDAAERERGRIEDRTRSKFASVAEMLEASRSTCYLDNSAATDRSGAHG